MLGTEVAASTLVFLIFFFLIPIIKVKILTYCGIRTMNYADVGQCTLARRGECCNSICINLHRYFKAFTVYVYHVNFCNA